MPEKNSETKTHDFAVVGNSLAAMVGALELARGGNSVVLWNPTPQWGAHFGGLVAAGRRFDIGMNLLEFTSFAAQSDAVESYSAQTRNDCARFTSVIREYVGGLVDYVPADAPQSLLHGAFSPDPVIANRLALLDTFTAELRQRISRELEACVADFQQAPALHARNKLRQPELFAATDYRTVSLANHGPTLHDLLIEPACQRILGLRAEEISALLHRVAWTPLYYPETLLQHLQGTPPMLPPTEFFYPRAGAFSAVVAALEHHFGETPGVEVRRGPLDRLVRNGPGWVLGDNVRAGRLVWALRPGQLTALLGGEDDFAAYRKASVHVAFATVDRAALVRRFSTLFVLDADSPIYRVTDQTWSAAQYSPEAICTIEIASAIATAWRADDLPVLAREIGGQLVRLGVLRDAGAFALHAFKYFKDAIVAPTTANRTRALAGHGQLAAAQPDVDLIGAAAPFGASSFNDQIVQGLRLGRIHRK
jgi:hypothetical protein